MLNQEMRFPIYRWVNGVTFIDAGNILGSDETFSWSEVKIGYGRTPLCHAGRHAEVDFGMPGSTLPTSAGPKAQHPQWRALYPGIGRAFSKG